MARTTTLQAVNEVVREAVELGEVDARVHDLNIELRVSPEATTAVVDPIQVQQVILNLIRNGIEAMQGLDTEQRAIIVAIEPTDGDFVEVRISDRGVGLAKATAARVFTPFFTTKPAGMGMGLSISRSIISAHGGNLWFTPNREKGTTFHFTLPVTAAARRTPS